MSTERETYSLPTLLFVVLPMADQRFEKLTTKLRHLKIFVIISIVVVALLSMAGLVAYIFYSLGEQLTALCIITIHNVSPHTYI